MRWRARHEPDRPVERGLGPLVDGDTVLPGGERRRWIDLLNPPDGPDEESTAGTDRGRR